MHYVQKNLFGESAVLNNSTDSVVLFSNEEIVDAAYEYHIKSGFPYINVPIHVSMQELNKLRNNHNSNVLQKSNSCMNIANTYHPHRFHVRCNDHLSPYDAFLIEKKLRKSLLMDLKHGGLTASYPSFLSIVSGTQAASNFRPAYAAYIYRKYCKLGNTVLDTSAGFGGRLTGFIASGIDGKYIGIDPSELTHNGNDKLSRDLGKNIQAEFIQLPAEDVDASELPAVDLCFTSPPYFDREHYSDEDTQSYKRYTTPETWKIGFLQKMITLQYNVLKSGGYNIINIANIKYKNSVLPLEQWTTEIAKETGFSLVNLEQYKLNNRIGSGNDGNMASEPVFVFKKP